MAIGLQCVNVITPLDNIRKCMTAAEYKRCYEGIENGDISCRDEYLYRMSFMSSDAAFDYAKSWEKDGLVMAEKVDGKWKWKDLCIVDIHEGLYHPCDWLEVKGGVAWMKGKPPGEVVGRMPKNVEVLGIRFN